LVFPSDVVSPFVPDQRHFPQHSFLSCQKWGSSFPSTYDFFSLDTSWSLLITPPLRCCSLLHRRWFFILGRTSLKFERTTFYPIFFFFFSPPWTLPLFRCFEPPPIATTLGDQPHPANCPGIYPAPIHRISQLGCFFSTAGFFFFPQTLVFVRPASLGTTTRCGFLFPRFSLYLPRTFC